MTKKHPTATIKVMVNNSAKLNYQNIYSKHKRQSKRKKKAQLARIYQAHKYMKALCMENTHHN